MPRKSILSKQSIFKKFHLKKKNLNSKSQRSSLLQCNVFIISRKGGGVSVGNGRKGSTREDELQSFLIGFKCLRPRATPFMSLVFSPYIVVPYRQLNQAIHQLFCPPVEQK